MIPRADYRILLATSSQGTGTYDHLRGLAIHARALNPELPTEERSSGELARWTSGEWVVRRNFVITADGIEDGPSPDLGSSNLWVVHGMMAFPDMGHAENALAHVEALALQGAAVLTAADVSVLPPSTRNSRGMLHECRHESDPHDDCVPLQSFRIEIGAEGIIEWAPGQVVAVDDLRTYQGPTYRCIQAHTTQESWEPPNVPALWELVE